MIAAPPRPLPWTLPPADALARWPRDWPLAMLHSGRLHRRWSRYTILGRPTEAVRFDPGPPARARWVGKAPAGVRASLPADPFDALVAALDPADPAIWIGYLGYDLGRWIETIPQRARADRAWPIYQMQRCPGFLVHDGQTGRWWAHGEWAEPGAAPALDAEGVKLGMFHVEHHGATTPEPDFIASAQRVIDYIAAGDVFQVNLAHRLTARWRGDPRRLYAALSAVSPAWYGAYVELLDEGPVTRCLASTSPELFFELSPGGRVVTRPVKGTRPARADPAELRDSVKDQAELAMIVDLLRNDLGRVCRFGSVRVPEPRVIESHPTVHHGTATVTGQLREGLGLADLLRATVPGGSITGTPKIRAMQIIDELEPVRRGPYCGAIGCIWGPSACFNIAIRTMLLEIKLEPDAGRADFSVGAGIVADSDPRAEYAETMDKAAALLAGLRAAAAPEPEPAVDSPHFAKPGPISGLHLSCRSGQGRKPP